MSHAVRFGTEAVDELEAAAAWYESRHAGLGESFIEAVEVAVGLIAEWPGAGALVPAVPAGFGVRRVPVQGFPFHLAYVAAGREVRILAVAHDRRRPGYWRARA